MIWTWLFWFLLLGFVGGAFLAFFLFFPHKIVEFQSKFYREIYKTQRKMSDREIDSEYQFPTDRFFMGPRSRFIADAPNEPREWTRLLIAYRAIGVLVLIFWLISMVGMVCVLTEEISK